MSQNIFCLLKSHLRVRDTPTYHTAAVIFARAEAGTGFENLPIVVLQSRKQS